MRPPRPDLVLLAAIKPGYVDAMPGETFRNIFRVELHLLIHLKLDPARKDTVDSGLDPSKGRGVETALRCAVIGNGKLFLGLINIARHFFT